MLTLSRSLRTAALTVALVLSVRPMCQNAGVVAQVRAVPTDHLVVVTHRWRDLIGADVGCRLSALSAEYAKSDELVILVHEECPTLANDPVRVLRLGESYIRLGQTPDVMTAWENTPNVDRYYLNRANSALLREDLALASQYVQFAESWSVRRSDVLYIQALVAAKAGNRESALALAEAAIGSMATEAREPVFTHLEKLYGAGLMAADLGAWETARSFFEQVIAVRHDSAHAWLRLGMVLQNGFDDPDGAESAYLTAIDLADLAWAHGSLGRLHIRRGSYAEGARRLMEAYRRNHYEPFAVEATDAARRAGDAALVLEIATGIGQAQ